MLLLLHNRLLLKLLLDRHGLRASAAGLMLLLLLIRCLRGAPRRLHHVLLVHAMHRVLRRGKQWGLGFGVWGLGSGVYLRRGKHAHAAHSPRKIGRGGHHAWEM